MASAVATAKAGKRPLRSLTAHEKLTAIRRVHDGESKASVARDIGVPESTLRGWCKNEEKISYLSRQSSPDSDESSGDHPIIKRPRTDDIQPYNLSLKADLDNGVCANMKKNIDHDSSSATTPSRSKLAKLSAEMGLNRPEIFASTASSVASGNFNNKSPSELVGLFLQWNNVYQQTLFLQQKLQKGNAAKLSNNDSIANNVATNNKIAQGLLTTVDKAASTTAEQILGYDLAAYYIQQQRLNQQQQSTANNTNGTTNNNTPITSAATLAEQQKWWANYYKKMFPNLQLQNLLNFTSSNSTNVSTSVSSTTSNHNTNTTTTQSATPNTTNNAVVSSSNVNNIAKIVAATTTNNAQSSVNNVTTSSPPTNNITTATASITTTSNVAISAASTPEKPILYQQLTKNEASNIKDAQPKEGSENLSTEEAAKPKANKGRSVLDNILLNNNTIRSDAKKQEGEVLLSQQEALEHGQKFLRWLETCGDPSVTAVQILTLQSLMKNLKADRKNGDVSNKAKVKRK